MEDQKKNVLVVGELNVDLILNKLDKFPEIGKEVFANEMKQTLGSSSAIFANNLSMLGVPVSFVGKVGFDSYAAFVTAALKQSGVDINNILKSPTLLTGMTVAFNFGNDRAMVTYPGAMSELKIQDISDNLLQSASHLHLSSIFLQEGLKPDITQLFKRAKSYKMTTSLDPQFDPKELWDLKLNELLPFVDVFLPNETEIKKLTGASTIEDGIQKVSPFCNIVVVKNGTKGALMWDKTKMVSQPAYLNENVVDAIGAGDSFNAGFISRYIKQRPLEECLDYGVLLGAANTTAAGGTGAFKSMDILKATIERKFNKKVNLS
jgi:sugar/nucleoside kinase (ribokinase family)